MAIGHGPVEMLVSSVWEGRRVLVTGHTGFKGSWLALWLEALGAEVTGFALPAPTEPSLFESARVGQRVRHIEGDVRDLSALHAVFAAARPEMVFHLAAQPLVRLSYTQPVETFATNVMGTVNVLEAARQSGGVRAILAVTSDKCYENREWIWPYREVDPMGGHDPYSSSKGCAELVISAWRRSYFASEGPLLASARAGNVFGGGDWAADRLVPDLVRAFAAGTSPLIRSPQSVRPWQHVLEALRGYLLLAEKLMQGRREFADGWNFGPADEDAQCVGWIVDQMRALWAGASAPAPDTAPRPHEAGLLRLDSSRARAQLGWQPALPLARGLEWTAAWHRAVADGGDPLAITLGQIAGYEALTAAREPVSAAA